MTYGLVSVETNMSVAKRFWEGVFKKGATTIGFGEGTVSIDRNVQFHYDLGSFDLAARRSTARVIECTIDHGYISATMLLMAATGAADATFNIDASMSDHALRLSGCMITTYDFELPSDGWITESINVRVKSFR